jgi:hypothetical protein
MANRSTRRAAERRTSRSAHSGRTTAKGTRPDDVTGHGRYTPPVPKYEKVSPPWVPALMFTLLILGGLVIVLNYMNLLPGEESSNWYLLLGLGLITGGFATATQYH